MMFYFAGRFFCVLFSIIERFDPRKEGPVSLIEKRLWVNYSIQNQLFVITQLRTENSTWRENTVFLWITENPVV